MELSNEQTKSKYAAMVSSVEPLRGGFGGSDDSVGSSYHYFYSDEYQWMDDLGSSVKRESAACERVRKINVDSLCQKASDLVARAKSYPML